MKQEKKAEQPHMIAKGLGRRRGDTFQMTLDGIFFFSFCADNKFHKGLNNQDTPAV